MFTMQELAKLRVAHKRNNPSMLEGKLREQYDAGEYKAIKVMQYSLFENDSYVELWQTVEKPTKYYGRYVYGLPVWYHVCDPFGYCELDTMVKDNIIFIVCDAEGNELFGTSNLHGADFPKFKDKAKQEWNRIKEEHSFYEHDENVEFFSQWLGNGTINPTDKWLISFMDPEKYGKEIADMYGYEINWTGCWSSKEISRDIIGGFDYIGEKYYILKITYEHTVCKKRYYEYWATDKLVLGKWDSDLVFLASYHSGEVGPMYTENDAIKYVSEKLKEIYNGKQISMIHNSYGYIYERFISYKDAAQYIINRDNNREHIDEKLRKEKEEHTFYDVDDPEIEKKYPNCERDHSYNYDFLGRRMA